MKNWLYIILLFFKDTKIVYLFFNAKKKIKRKLKTVDTIFIFPYYHVGGSEKVHYRVSQIAKQSGLKPLFIFTGVSTSEAYKTKFEALGPVVDIGFRYSNHKINTFLKMYLVLIMNNSNLKLLFGSNSSFFYEITEKIEGKKIVDLVHTYNPPYEVSNVVYDFTFYKFSKRILINSNALLNMLNYYRVNLNNLDSSHLQLIYNSPFDNENEPKYSVTKECLGCMNIVFVSRNSPEKKPELAFKIAKQLTEHLPDKFSFKMIGDFDAFKDKYVSKNIQIITDIKDANEIIPYYKDAHCLILTSETEGFPLVVAEGMFFNVVPVCTNVGGISGVIKNNINGFLIESNSSDEEIIKSFIYILQQLSQNNKLFNDISSKTFLTAQEYFGNDKFINEYKKIFTI